MFLHGFGFYVYKNNLNHPLLEITHSKAAQTYDPNKFSGKVNGKGYIYIISPLGGKISMELVEPVRHELVGKSGIRSVKFITKYYRIFLTLYIQLVSEKVEFLKKFCFGKKEKKPPKLVCLFFGFFFCPKYSQ